MQAVAGYDDAMSDKRKSGWFTATVVVLVFLAVYVGAYFGLSVFDRMRDTSGKFHQLRIFKY